MLSVDTGDSELDDLAHEKLVVPPHAKEGLVTATAADVPPLSFDLVTHLVSAAAGEQMDFGRRTGLRARLGRLLDAVTGPSGDTGP